MKKRILSMMFAVMLLLTAINVNSITVEAAGKITIYETNVVNISKFVKSKGKLTVKADEWTKKSVKNKKNWVSMERKAMSLSGKEIGAKTISYKISKNCKWSWYSTDGSNGKEKYSNLKKNIKCARRFYKETGEDFSFGTVQIFVKNKKIVRIVTCGA